VYTQLMILLAHPAVLLAFFLLLLFLVPVYKQMVFTDGGAAGDVEYDGGIWQEIEVNV